MFNGVDFKLNLGLADQQNKAGFLWITSNAPSAKLAQQAGLQIPFTRPNVQALADGTNGYIGQVLTPQGLVNVNVISSQEYHLECYYSNNITGQDGDGYYRTGSATPFVTWKIHNTDGTSYTSLNVTEQRSGAADRVFQYFQNPTTMSWSVLLPDGTTTISNWLVQVYGDSSSTNYFEEYLSSGQVLSKTQKTFKYVSADANLLLTQEIDGDGSVTRTTTYTYYSTDATNGASTNLLRRVDYPEGNWVYYTYDSMGRKSKEYSAYNNSAPPSDVTVEPSDVSTYQCKLTEYSYSLNSTDDGTTFAGDTNNPTSPCKTVVKLPAYNGSSWALHEVSRAYQETGILWTNGCAYSETQICPDPGMSWNASNNLRTVAYNSVTNDFTAGLPLQILRPDGTMTFYSYAMTPTNLTAVETTGAPDGGLSYIVEGTRTVTVQNDIGQLSSQTVNPIYSGTNSLITTARDMYCYNDVSGGYLDQLRRSYIVTNLAGLTTQYSYSDCCGLSEMIDQEGTTTTYLHDSLKRKIGTSALSITNLNTLDGVGQVLQTQRIGTDNSVITMSQMQYDILGRVLCQTNALGGITTTSNVVVSSQLFITNVYPDGGTRIEVYNRDGSLASISGTATAPTTYAYGAEQDGSNWREFTLTTKLTSGGGTNEWIKTYTDGASRNYKTVYASASTNPFTVSYFNSRGQLTNKIDPDGISKIYVYDAKGEQTHAIVDMNQNGSIDWSGPDRISLNTNDVLFDNGANVIRSRAYVWNTNADSPLLISTQESSVDGLINWNILWNNGSAITSSNFTTHDATYGRKVVTSFASDGSYSVSSNQYGRLLSVTKYSSTGSQLMQTIYGYDAHGRRSTQADARNGTTTYYFNNADQVAGIAAPLSQVTSNYFDSNLRNWKVTLPDGTSQTNEFYMSGQIKRQYGSREYPVGYGYDSQWRMTSMTNWSGLAGSSGARITTWNYDAYRGFNTNKVYDGGSNGPAYTYTAAGQLLTRLWARGTNTTYGYNSAGELLSTSYNDGVTPGITNGFDRRGRKIAITNGNVACSLAYNDQNQVVSEAYVGGPLDTISITNGFDGLLRRIQNTTLKGGSVLTSVTNGFDAASRLATVSDGTNSAVYSYIANSMLISNIVFAQSGTTKMTTTKSYDNLNRLTSISNVNASSVVFDSHVYVYNSANQRSSVTNADGTYWIYQYDGLGQLISGIKHWSDGMVVAGQQFGYAFDDIGNRTTTTSGGDQWGRNTRESDYTVNNLNQYTRRTVPGNVSIIGSATNHASVTVNGQGAYRRNDYFWGELSLDNTSAVWQPVTNLAVLQKGTNPDIIDTNIGNVFMSPKNEFYTNDPDGNLLQDGRWTYVWDAENRLVNMTSLTNGPVGSKLKLDFVYDYQSRRVQKTVSTWGGSAYSPQSTNRFLYDNWNLIEVFDPALSPQASFMWGLDLSGSMQDGGGVGGLLSITQYAPTNTQQFVCYDGNGNVMSLADASNATIIAQYEYGPFGETIRATGPMAKVNPFRFSTKFEDDECALLYYGYRYLNASTGRWLNNDPLCERFGMEVYTFVENSPVATFDIDGRSLSWTWMGPAADVKNDCGYWYYGWKLNTDITSGRYWFIQHITLLSRFTSCKLKVEHPSDEWWEAKLITFLGPRSDIIDRDRRLDHPSSFGSQSSEGVVAFIGSSRDTDNTIRGWGTIPEAPGMFATRTDPHLVSDIIQTARRFSSSQWACCCEHLMTATHSP